MSFTDITNSAMTADTGENQGCYRDHRPNQATADSRNLYRQKQAKYGSLPDCARVFCHRPAVIRQRLTPDHDIGPEPLELAPRGRNNPPRFGIC